MTDDAILERARRAFDDHDAFAPASEADGASGNEEEGGDGYRLSATAFDGGVDIQERDGPRLRYRLTIRTPTLSAATEEEMGPNLEAGWFETYELRLEDAPGAVRGDVGLDDLTVRTEGGEAIAEFTLVTDVDRAPAVARAVADYVEGTYVEGVVPGFTYEPPVAELLNRARQAGDGDGTGPMPL